MKHHIFDTIHYRKGILTLLVLMICQFSTMADSYQINGLNYTVSEGTAKVTGSDDISITSLTIPSSINVGATIYPVTAISAGAFRNCTGIKEFTLEDGTTEIVFGENIFANSPLEDVYLGRDFSYTGYYSGRPFSGKTTIKAVTIGGSATLIPDRTFFGCTGISSLTFGHSLSTIGDYAFYGCSSLSELDIPTSVTHIGIRAFDHCTGVLSLTFESSTDCPVNGTYIDDSAFNGCKSIKSLKFGNTVTTIGIYAFYGCSNLTELSIPNSVLSIGNKAFEKCAGINKVTFEDGDKDICLESDIFAYCPIEKVNLGRTYRYIGSNNSLQPFYGKETIESVTFSNSVTSIPESAFYGCSSLTDITIPSSVTSIGNCAFYGCTGIKSLVLKDSDSEIAFAESTLRDCPLEKVYLGRAYRYTGSDNSCQPFYGKGTILLLTVGQLVTAVPDYAFYGCTGIKEINISPAVDYIGNEVFYGCTGLKVVTFEDGNNELCIGSAAFLNCPIEKVYIGRAFTYSKSYDYGHPFYGKETITSVTIGNTVSNLPIYAFYGCTGLTSLSLGNSLTSIGGSAFFRCTGLTELTIPNTVTDIGHAAFSQCTGLKSLSLGNSLISIGEDAFRMCQGITELNIPSSVTSICSSAFSGCTGLTEITIPASVADIRSFAFNYCTGISSVTLEDGDSEISVESDAFTKCPIKKVYLGRTFANSKTLFYGIYHPFSNHETIESVTIGNSVIALPRYAFDGCTGIVCIDCLADTPPFAYDNSFSDETYSHASLRVPDGSLQFYRDHDIWSKFTSLGSSSSLGAIDADKSDTVSNGIPAKGIDYSQPFEVYNLQGQLLGTDLGRLAAGSYIIRQQAYTWKIHL